MTVRFLQTTASAVEGFPFMPGQTITLTGMTPELRQWLKTGHAEIVREDATETAVQQPTERAVTRTSKRA